MYKNFLLEGNDEYILENNLKPTKVLFLFITYANLKLIVYNFKLCTLSLM